MVVVLPTLPTTATSLMGDLLPTLTRDVDRIELDVRIMQEERGDRAGENARDEGFEESHGYSIALFSGYSESDT